MADPIAPISPRYPLVDGTYFYATNEFKIYLDALWSRTGGVNSSLVDFSAITTGFIVKTGTTITDYVGRSITGTAGQVSVSNGDGVVANPTLSLASTAVTPATYAIN